MDSLGVQPQAQARSDLFSKGREFSYDRNDLIIRAGDTPSGIYYIKSGWVQVFSICNDGEPNIVFTLYAGDVFPLAWATTGILRDINFSALGNTKLLRLSREEYLQALDDEPAIKNDTLSLLSSYSCSFTEELDNLQYRTARERVCYRLLVLASHFGKPLNSGIGIDQVVTNEYIARSTNMTRETASREMSNLAKRNIISTTSNHIIICDVGKLKQALNHDNDFFGLVA